MGLNILTSISQMEDCLNVPLILSTHRLVLQLLRFIAIIKTHQCGVAVHCKAGLGRTGTVICSYLMYEFGMTAEQAIGYCRICRPGSVVGCQQHFLKVSLMD